MLLFHHPRRDSLVRRYWSQGETKEQAIFNIHEAVSLFLGACYEIGTLNQVLHDETITDPNHLADIGDSPEQPPATTPARFSEARANERPLLGVEGHLNMLHDENYKRLFAFPLMVEHLLRATEVRDALDEVDFDTLAKLSTEYVSDDLLKRHGDTVWRVRLRNRWVYLLVMLEFQSRDDRWMALRILTYTGLLYEELVRNGAPEAATRETPVVS